MKISEAAKVVRSKNAGPFELTFDIIFQNREFFEAWQRGGAISAADIARLYQIAESDVLKIVWFEPANAVKITIKRPLASGAPGESDVYGAQQHAPLLKLEF